jgi:hypothetical protein
MNSNNRELQLVWKTAAPGALLELTAYQSAPSSGLNLRK